MGNERETSASYGRVVDVAVVHWPAEADRLARMRAAHEPRLVVVEHGPPPTTADELEDWLRAPVDEAELRIRIATLRERAERHRPVVCLDDGILRVGGRLVVLPPIQARLAAALLERLDAVVPRESLAARAWPGCAPPGRNVLDVHMAKLRRLVSGTGLEIRTVHRRGYLAHLAGDAPGSPLPGTS